LKILEQYKLAPEVTRERMYLETMERLLGGTDKVIMDGQNQGVVPFLPLRELAPRAQPQQQQGGSR
jgi:membrane protease subunit HflK